MDGINLWYLLNEDINSDFISHNVFPSPNLLSAETLSEVSKPLNEVNLNSNSFPFYQPFPFAVQQSSFLFCGSSIIDDASELVERKCNWEMELKNLKVSNIDTVIKTIKRLKQNKTVKLSNSLKKYIDYFCLDPEPMFSGNYNWLYTGGCLCLNEKSDETYLISGDFANKPGFNFSLLNKTGDKILKNSFYELKACSPVLQITCKDHRENLIICLRQKNCLSLFNANKAEPVPERVKLWHGKTSNSELFTCIDVEPNCEKIIVTNTNHEIQIFQVERKNKVYSYSTRDIVFNDIEDAWNQIEFGDAGVYWALRNRFVIFDLRDFSSGPKFSFEPSSITKPCESITSFMKSQSDPNTVYLSTTHSVLQVDLRKEKAVQRWTHLMNHPPQFMATVKDKDECEVLLLQSSSVDEISGIINERFNVSCNAEFVSKSLPSLLKSVKDFLNLARVRGVCLNPSVVERVDFHVTGMKCLKNNQGDFNLFTTNSGGDIFLSKINSKSSSSLCKEEDEKEIIKGMEIYESDLEEVLLKKSMLNVEFTDMSGVLQNFQHSKVKTRENQKHKTKWKLDKMNEFKNLNRFRDPLARKTIQIWISPEEIVEEMDMEAEIRSIEAKVLDWMSKMF